MKISEMENQLKEIREKHGDLDLYEHNDCATISKYETSHRPQVSKIYYQKWEDANYMKEELSDGDINKKDSDLFDVDLSKPIIAGVII